ncbi:MAG: sugar phosphate isomerase/epimerase [Clostridiales bacterium]|nr:sugar phosphate isomerase/epimerase [Clostridiales bacterium]
MRYGYATGFASPIKDAVDYRLLDDIQAAGFDFAEFPLALLASLPLDECRKAAGRLDALGLGADSCCNMFPPSVRITGPKRDWQHARAYLDGAFERMTLLGVRKVVFGSSGARNLPEGTTPAEGYRQVIDFVGEVVLPFLEAHRMVLAMEPIGHYEANFINTLDDGMRVVRGVNHPRVRLLADSVHVLYEGEDPHHLKDYAQHLEHIHVCEAERALPLGQVSEGLKRFLTILQATGYDKTLSFEPVPYALPEMRTALNTVKSYFI